MKRNIDNEKVFAILTDTTRCTGCETCVGACKQTYNLGRDRAWRWKRHVDDLSSTRFCTILRRPQSHFVRQQCRHCLDPACVSACIVGALTRAADGAVVYNPAICIGCRYCMIACPFQIPAYEYSRALLPQIRKCGFCAEPKAGRGADPACAAACPSEALLFGKRAALLRAARERIAAAPKRYVQNIYGEREAGGTAWLYLAGRPFTELGLLDVAPVSPAVRTEGIQHGVYRYGIIPLALYGLLGGLMWRQRRLRRKGCPAAPSEDGDEK